MSCFNARRTSLLARVAASSAAIVITGCAEFSSSPSCPQGKIGVTVAELYFGRDVGRTEGVSDSDWQSFLDEVITPRYPDGLTVENANGQWKDGAGIVRERSIHLTIVLKGGPDDEAKLSDIRAAYRQRFRQDSVLLLEEKACASF